MKPAWWQLCGIRRCLVLLIAIVEANVPEGHLRTILDSAAVVIGFGLMLAWRRHNRTAFELERRR
jgi:hypothetical protein